MVREKLIELSKLIRGEIPTRKLISMGLKVGKNFYRGGWIIRPIRSLSD